jgi:hypothetical protein
VVSPANSADIPGPSAAQPTAVRVEPTDSRPFSATVPSLASSPLSTATLGPAYKLSASDTSKDTAAVVSASPVAAFPSIADILRSGVRQAEYGY